MTLALPTVAATDWIVTELAGLPAMDGVPVFVASAAEETPRPMRDVAGPYVTLRHFPGEDVRYLGGRLAGSRVVVEVTAWDEGTDVARIGPIVDAFHGAIDAQRGSQGGVAIRSCLRVAPVERQIAEDNRLFTQLGGEYRVRVAAA